MADYTLLKFSADWCQPCKLTARALEIALLRQQPGTFELVDIDIEENPLTATQYQVRSLPTLVVLDSEKLEVARFVGSLDRSQALSMLESLLTADSVQ